MSLVDGSSVDAALDMFCKHLSNVVDQGEHTP
jgi:hypothetical protein